MCFKCDEQKRQTESSKPKHESKKMFLGVTSSLSSMCDHSKTSTPKMNLIEKTIQ